MTGLKRTPLLPHNSNSSTPSPPHQRPNLDPTADKENFVISVAPAGCGNGHVFASAPWKGKKLQSNLGKTNLNKVAFKSSWDPLPSSSSSDVWEFSDSESAPASSWSTLPNRSLLCRPLPLDVGRCTCIIAKEKSNEIRGVAIYSLYTNEGQGRQDRKLAVARHRRRKGRSEFIIAQNPQGIFSTSDESFLGTMSANLMGSKYQIWDQGHLDSSKNHSKRLLGVAVFIPTITTLTGSFRSIRAWIPKQQSMQIKNTNTTQIQHINGLPKDWEEKRNRSHQLFSRVPYYNHVTKRYELDFRERAGRAGHKVQTSVKNFQLTMEEKGRQTILQLGRIGKSKYVMDFRYPLTGYHAFCLCLASIDSKLCCSL
ncbi:tubby-like protein 4 [Typha latifolia]|uniref:tubby-like protein 4 n=1 Tax=Typha latifolia TaxID=4733 RepID=UPI003C3074C9